MNDNETSPELEGVSGFGYWIFLSIGECCCCSEVMKVSNIGRWIFASLGHSVNTESIFALAFITEG